MALEARKGANLANVGAGFAVLSAVLAVSIAINIALLGFLPGVYQPKQAGYGQSHTKTSTNTAVQQPLERAKDETSVSSTSGSLPASQGSVINLDHGDPTMFESFWRANGEEATIVIPGWQTMSYFSDVSNLCWFLEPEFAKQIRRLHGLVGNAVVEDRHIVVGTGSTQLFQAALYALSPSDGLQPIPVISAVPYYSSYPAVTDFLHSGLFRWAGDANAFQGENYIELVCSPNNPDGFMKEAVLKSDTGKTIHDLAYYWPQYTAISSPANHDIMLFTASKSTGHAGTRVGWALVKDQEIAKRMTKYIELNSLGVSKDSQLRAAKILKVISDGYEFPSSRDVKLFDFGRNHMRNRWERLREVVRETGIFSLPEFPSEDCSFTGDRTSSFPAFAWVKCEWENAQDCAAFLKSHNILTRSGKHFGVGLNYARVSMLDRDETFDIFIQKLYSIK
ncbi:tryptophan aminotransferase-related protein 2-like [Dioscorea cayenensis subsp. rotundata]|uniref:Tryptophan aminotransferase-related protein 2-like n=1 Tax=Dioscorea cayennensis subsp. rotundata TaxID=55577 RepID=A0AB40CSP9_DIOCR|nr:tryptophan aminotransferase-related protein 2-like [Dioscorea cayenensis subsp. rotundata]